LDEIHLCKGLVAPGLLNIKDGDDILMVEVPQQLHLAQSPKAEHRVVEWSNLLDRNLLSAGLVKRRTREGRGVSIYGNKIYTLDHSQVPMPLVDLPDDSVSTFSYHILDIVLLGDIEGDLARPGGIRRARHVIGFEGGSAPQQGD
jgi:hypothetical protein